MAGGCICCGVPMAKLYTGVTTDPQRRLAHIMASVQVVPATRCRRPVALVWRESGHDRSECPQTGGGTQAPAP